MALIDELERLHQLHREGALSDDEFVRAKARLLAADTAAGHARADAGPGLAAVNGLRRSRHDRWLGGVCGGLAVVSGLDSWAWRLIVLVLALWGGAGLLVYVLLWLFVPDDAAG